MPIAPGTFLVYTIRPGDTLFAIANRFGVSVQSIVQANSLFPPVTDPDLIFPGQVLLIKTPEMSQQSTVFYNVSPGDTLFRISERFSASVDLVAGINQIPNPNLIFVNQNILVPAFVYEVESGDSLFRISQRFGVPLSAIFQANRGRIGLSPDVVYPGFQLIVPLPTSTNIVVFQPLPGTRIAPGQPLSGFARAFEAVILYEIRDNNNLIITRERPIMTSEGGPAYGSFSTPIQFDQSPSTQQGSLLVYTRSPRDGSIQDLVQIRVLF